MSEILHNNQNEAVMHINELIFLILEVNDLAEFLKSGY